jgi:homocysteine S-methyltransferase
MDEHHINDGSKIKNCVSMFKNHPRVFAIGVNCTDPKYISGIIKIIKEVVSNKKIIVYPNSGEVYNAKSKTWMGLSEPDSFLEMTRDWLELGANILGGCCRIGPDHIKRIYDTMVNDNRNY